MSASRGLGSESRRGTKSSEAAMSGERGAAAARQQSRAEGAGSSTAASSTSSEAPRRAVQRLAAAGGGGDGRASDWEMSDGLVAAMGLAGGSGPAATAPGAAETAVQRKATSAPVWSGGGARGERGDRGSAPGDVGSIASAGVAGASAPAPYQSEIQQSFGRHDISDVRAQVGGDAAAASRAIGAEAYATGDRLAFSQAPDLRTAAHEAAHVVQQRQGISLPGGVGSAGDAHERHADAVADAVVAGRSAEGLLDQYGGGGGSSGAGGASGGAVQRQDATATPAPDPAHVAQIEWAVGQAIERNFSETTIREVQAFCATTQTGVFDAVTAEAVFQKQRELRITATGVPNETFFHRAGIIATNPIAPANVTDPVLAAVMEHFPGGVTVAIYTAYEPFNRNDDEFRVQAGPFAVSQQAIGLENGEAVLGVPCPITDLGDVIEVVQSIHLGLLAKWQASQPAGASTATASATTAPAFTKVKNLALFSHGVRTAAGLDGDPEYDQEGKPFHDVYGDGLHSEDTNGVNGINPANVEAFVRGLGAAVVPSVRVQLFACYTGASADRTEGTEWRDHTEGDRAGEGSLASALATELGPQATVSAHTTKGHTTENFAARVFGAEGGGGPLGTTLFEVIYPRAYVEAQVTAIFGADATGDAARYQIVREQMWLHFIDVIDSERARDMSGDGGRFATPMGQEAFVNPERARQLIHADWESVWVTEHREEMLTAAGETP